MRTFFQEFYKTIVRRSFLFVLLLALFLNFCLLFTRTAEDRVPSVFYQKVYDTVQSLSKEAQIPYILEQAEKQAEVSPLNIEETYEQQVFRRLAKHAAQVEHYPDYLADIQSQAEQSGISIFQDTSEYARKNLAATAKAFSSFEGTELSFVNSMTFADSTDFVITDILILALLFYLVMSMTIYEKEHHLFKLLRCTKKGRSSLIMSKSMLLVLGSLCFTLLFWGCNAFTAALKFGRLDFSAPLQSVYGYDGSILPLTIGQYLLLFLLCKMIVYTAVSFLMLGIALKTKYTIRVYIYTLFTFLLSFALYHFIDGNSSLQIFHYLNLIPLIRANDVFRFYFNLNFFQTPVNIIPLSVSFLVLLLLMFMAFNIYTFSSDKWDSSILQKKRLFRNSGRIPGTSLFCHELYRLLISQKGIFIFVLLFALQGWLYTQKPGIQMQLNTITKIIWNSCKEKFPPILMRSSNPNRKDITNTMPCFQMPRNSAAKENFPKKNFRQSVSLFLNRQLEEKPLIKSLLSTIMRSLNICRSYMTPDI